MNLPSQRPIARDPRSLPLYGDALELRRSANTLHAAQIERHTGRSDLVHVNAAGELVLDEAGADMLLAMLFEKQEASSTDGKRRRLMRDGASAQHDALAKLRRDRLA